MTPRELRQVEGELTAFGEGFLGPLGDSRRCRACADYTRGLALDGERKSQQPMAARLCAKKEEQDALRQRMQEAVGQSDWEGAVVLAPLACHMEAALPGVEALGVDDTDVRKSGKASVGVARQYAGSIKAVDDCQVLVGLHLLGPLHSCPLSMQLYLPREWADDRARREKALVPEDVVFEEKWRIALHLLEDAQAWGVVCRTVVADAAYGEVLDFRRGLQKAGFTYGVGIKSSLVFWADDSLLPPLDTPLSAEALARALPKRAWRSVAWREGTKGTLQSRFAAVRVQAAPDWTKGCKPEAPEWLLIEWPKEEEAPVHYWVSNAPLPVTLKYLVHLCTLRWRVEYDYEELKSELGFDHYEGRHWRGLHHHVALCLLTYAFLALQRAFPPSGVGRLAQGPKAQAARVDAPAHLSRSQATATAGAAPHAGLLPHLPQAPAAPVAHAPHPLSP